MLGVDIDGRGDDEFGEMEVDDEGMAQIDRAVRRRQILLQRRERSARQRFDWWGLRHGFDSRVGQRVDLPTPQLAVPPDPPLRGSRGPVVYDDFISHDDRSPPPPRDQSFREDLR